MSDNTTEPRQYSFHQDSQTRRILVNADIQLNRIIRKGIQGAYQSFEGLLMLLWIQHRLNYLSGIIDNFLADREMHNSDLLYKSETITEAPNDK